jgi:proton-dependent oligopeptide transporter, POT family
MRKEYWIMILAWVLVGIWVAFVFVTNRKVHPKALFLLFLVELWERFSYYGMRALLVLYLTSQLVNGGFGMEEKAANGIYAAYGALVYLTPLLGGFLSDKILGSRKAIIWGALLMAAGQFTLSQSPGNTNILYAGLGLLVLGNGFFKPNISSLVGKFYEQGDSRRDGAFTIFYMGINIGAFLTPLTCGTIGEIEGWHYGFMCAGTGMLLGLAIFLYTSWSGVLEQYADPPAQQLFTKPGSSGTMDWFVYAGTFALLPIAAYLIYHNDLMDYILIAIGSAAILYMLFLSFQYEKEQRERIWVIVVLCIFTAVFWTFFELAGSALNLFTKKNVDRNILGVEFKTSNFQALNAFFIMLFAPIFSLMWIKLSKVGKEPAAPVKFAFGLLLLGAGFIVLNLGRGAATAGIMPGMFLVLLYLLHTLGELALSPVGLSLVTKLAPAKIVGFVMGFWFLSSAIAHQAGKWIANEATSDKDATAEQTLAVSLGVFNNVGLVAIGCGVFLLVLSPIIKKWMHGVK